MHILIWLVNYYYMWKPKSEILAPLTELPSEKSKWTWYEKHQKVFEQMKKVLSWEVRLAYADYSKPFLIHTDASDYKHGLVIIQNSKPIVFYFQNLSATQTCYRTTEKELLVIVEAIKGFKNILFGQRIVVYTDHKINL